jgi:hypothetical protein
MGISLPNNPGNLQNGPGFPNSAVDVLANDQAAAAWSVAHETAVNGVHGVASGAIVGTTNVQTLTNKTLTAPKIASGDAIFDDSGLRLLAMAHAASAVNYITLANAATTVSPYLSSSGTDANIGMQFVTKGTGSFVFSNDAGKYIATLVGGASLVNYLQLEASITTVALGIRALGTDANISVNIIPKGTGRLTENGANLLRTDTYQESVYNASSDISLGTTNDGAFADVDATNAKITFTVGVAGRYKVEFAFLYHVAFGVSANSNSATSFRLTDGTTPSDEVYIQDQSNAGANGRIIYFQVVVSEVYNFTAGAKTIKLQKQNLSSTNVTSRGVGLNTTGPKLSLTMRAHRIAD